MSETALERAGRESGVQAELSPLSKLSQSDRESERQHHEARVNRAEDRRRLARRAVDELRNAVAVAEGLAKSGEKFATANMRSVMPKADGVACEGYHRGIGAALDGLVTALGAAQVILTMREAEFEQVISATEQERYEAAFG